MLSTELSIRLLLDFRPNKICIRSMLKEKLSSIKSKRKEEQENCLKFLKDKNYKKLLRLLKLKNQQRVQKDKRNLLKVLKVPKEHRRLKEQKENRKSKKRSRNKFSHNLRRKCLLKVLRRRKNNLKESNFQKVKNKICHPKN